MSFTGTVCFIFTGTVFIFTFTGTVCFIFTGTVFIFTFTFKLSWVSGAPPVRAKPHEPVYAYMYMKERNVNQFRTKY